MKHLSKELETMKRCGWNENDIVTYSVKLKNETKKLESKELFTMDEAENFIDSMKKKQQWKNSKHELFLKFDHTAIPWMKFLYMYYVGFKDGKIPIRYLSDEELRKVLGV